MNEEQKNLNREINEIVKDVFTKEDIVKLTDKLEKDAKEVKANIDLLKACAFADQDKNMNRIYMSTHFSEYDALRHKELEFVKNKKNKEFTKTLKVKKKLIQVAFKKVTENDLKRIVYHKELEKRLKFQFEVGQGGYMSAYLGALGGI